MDSTVVTPAAADTNEADEIHQQLPPTVNGEHASPEDRELNSKLSSDKEQRSQDHSNNLKQQQTPNHNPTKTYNDYVNHVYEGTNGKANGNEEDEEGEDVKPLLKSIVKSPSGNVRPTLQMNGGMRSKNKRLSWQASDPSRHHVQFNHHNTNGNHQYQEGNENNTQSTSLDSSDEPGTNNEECPSSPITSSSSGSSSSDDEDDEFSEIKAPDGGWGWVSISAILSTTSLTRAILIFRLSCSQAL